MRDLGNQVMAAVAAGFVMVATVSAELYVHVVEVPAAGGSVSITNTYGRVVTIASGVNAFANSIGVETNNVVGKITRTASTNTAAVAVFSTGVTTNQTTSFLVNNELGINPAEIIVITNSAAKPSVMSLTLKK